MKLLNSDGKSGKFTALEEEKQRTGLQMGHNRYDQSGRAQARFQGGDGGGRSHGEGLSPKSSVHHLFKGKNPLKTPNTKVFKFFTSVFNAL